MLRIWKSQFVGYLADGFGDIEYTLFRYIEHLLLDMLDEIRQKYDLSILFSTHDFSTLRHYADKVILLQQAILKVGTPGEVLHSPEFQAVFHLNLGEEGGCAQ